MGCRQGPLPLIPVLRMTSDTLALLDGLRMSPGSTLVELGCGGGEACAIGCRRNPGCTWIGIDIRHGHLGAVRRAAAEAGCDLLLAACDAACVPSAFRPGFAGVVLANPPWMVEGECRISPDPERRISRSAGPLSPAVFCRAAAHCLADGGSLRLMIPPGSIPDALLACRAFDLGPSLLQPYGLPGRPASSARLEARKACGGCLQLLPQATLPS